MTKSGASRESEKRRYWLMKSEPSAFSIDDLANSPKRTTCWDGVRNYQARNFMRSMNVGDRVLFYHSNADPPVVVGIAEVVKTAYADPTQFDKKDKHYDAASDPSRPRWDMVDIKFVRKLSRPLTLDRLRKEAELKGMVLLRKGSRLSVQPVTQPEWNHIVKLAELQRGEPNAQNNRPPRAGRCCGGMVKRATRKAAAREGARRTFTVR